jgi:signal transduction histidine kinase
MNPRQQKVVQYLNKAHATEQALIRVLQSQIAMTPRGSGSYRSALKKHLGQTRDHARRVAQRLEALRQRSNPLLAVVGVAESVVGQVLALGKTPFDLLRGSGGEEKVLKNAKDAATTEALEIATYTALERLARGVGDDETARLAASICADEEQMLQRVLRDGIHDAALIHDVAFCDDPELLEGVSGSLLAAWRDERLLRELGTAARRLEDSRRRIADAGDLERARLARDLHDGVQQRLTALGIRLGLAQEQIKHDPDAAFDQIHDLGAEVELAIDELRSLTQGVHPPILTDRGLPDALRALTWPSSIRISVVAHHVTRHPIEIESAIYLTCREAVQNALKHSAAAACIRITIRQSAQALYFEVRDDGPGFASGASGGRGLGNMRHRMEAIGGRLVVESRPGRGTCVRGSLELAAESA